MGIGIFVLVSVGLALLYVWYRNTRRCWPLLIASGAWGLTAIYEWWFSNFYDPQHKYDIRVDMLLAVVLSFLITAFAAVWSIRRR
jgi:hypothetical protein